MTAPHTRALQDFGQEPPWGDSPAVVSPVVVTASVSGVALRQKSAHSVASVRGWGPPLARGQKAPGPTSAGRCGAGGALGFAAAILLRVPSTAANLEATFSRLPSSPGCESVHLCCLILDLILVLPQLAEDLGDIPIRGSFGHSDSGCPPSSECS